MDSNWDHVISIDLTTSVAPKDLDKTISKCLASGKWTKTNYDEQKLNCLNFVMDVLRNCKTNSSSFSTREELCEKLLQPQLDEARRYIAHLDSVNQQGIIMLNSAETQTRLSFWCSFM